MRKHLKDELKQFYNGIPECPDNGGLNQTLYEAKKEMTRFCYTDGNSSFIEFFLAQAGFIKKSVWTVQFSIVLLCGFFVIYGSEISRTLGTVSALLPLIFLAGTKELARPFVDKTAEMELTTRFTLYQVMLSKITLLGLSDVLILSLLSVMASVYLSVSLIETFMYFGVPFLITSFGCLCILNYVRTKQCLYLCAVWSTAVIAAAFSLVQWLPALYEKSLLWGWGILFSFSFLGVMIEGYCFVRRCRKNTFEVYAAEN